MLAQLTAVALNLALILCQPRAQPLDFALLVDGLAAEREQGITIDVAYRYFATPRRRFIVADTPGHEQYTRNMVTGASNAEVAVILIDARKGLLTQTRRHSYLVSLLGIRDVIVAVNKMDLVGYDPAVFAAINAAFDDLARRVGLARVQSIPVVAIDGDNIARRSESMAWYAGPTLLEALETVQVESSAAQAALRLPIQYVNRPDAEFRGYAGRVASGAVAVGDAVQARGTVAEFRSSSRPNDLSVTQLTATSSDGFTVLSSGNDLPEATVIGQDGRVPPNQLISQGTVDGTVEGSPFNPTQNGIDFYESLEGMRVQVNDAVAVGPTTSFGEIPVLADNGADASLRTARGGIVIQPDDFNPERIILDDGIVSREPEVNVGDRFTAPISGVIDYSFSNFKLLNTTTLSVTSGNLAPEVTELVGTANQLTLATFNVENLDPILEDINKVNQQSSSNVDDDLGDGKFAALANRIVNNLKSPDIISLEEIQDNTGAEIGDGVVDASLTYQILIAEILEAGGPRYEFRDIAPTEGADGGQPGGNIRVGFLFNPDRVSFVDRPGGSATTDTDLVNGSISASPGRLDPTNSAFQASRKPLVGEFVFNGQTVYVIGNHFNSKGGDQPLFGRFQPPTLTTEPQRLQQSQVVRQFVDQLLGVNPDAYVAVVGDLNDFQFSPPLDILTQGAALSNLMTTLPAEQQYTYNFEGNAQVLDHILVSSSLKPIAEVDIVHINSEFAQQVSDHDPIVSRFSFGATPISAPALQ